MSFAFQVYAWGCNDEGALGRKSNDSDECQPGLVDGLEHVKIVQVSAGDSHTAALTSTGEVYIWGVFRVSAIDVIEAHCCVVVIGRSDSEQMHSRNNNNCL